MVVLDPLALQPPNNIPTAASNLIIKDKTLIGQIVPSPQEQQREKPFGGLLAYLGSVSLRFFQRLAFMYRSHFDCSNQPRSTDLSQMLFPKTPLFYPA